MKAIDKARELVWNELGIGGFSMKVGDIHINKYMKCYCSLPCFMENGFCKKFKKKLFIHRGYCHRLDECYKYESKLKS